MSTAEADGRSDQKVSLPTLTAMVVGSMIGSGVFLLPRRFGTETGVLGAIIAWTIAGTGMLMLAFVFQRLATRKPDLDAGIFAYAKAGFGDYVGFNSAFGFWASACAGNTSYWVVIMTTTSALFPALGAGDTVIAVIASSVGVWLFFYLILRGVKEAAIINRIATIAKVVPILVFIVIAAIAFKGHVFADNFWGGDGSRRSRRSSSRPRAPCSSRRSCSWASRAPVSTPGSPASARTSGAPPSSDSSVCSAFSRW